MLKNAVTGGVIKTAYKTFSEGNMRQWDPQLITVGKSQLCRGVTPFQLNEIIKSGQVGQIPREGFADVQFSDLGRHVMRGGDPNLLSFTRNLYTANLYGANRCWFPQTGAIIVGCYPAVFTDISEQALMCPPMCDKEQEKVTNDLLMDSESYGREPADVAKISVECNEVAAVVGKQDGVDFGGMYDVNKHIHQVYRIMGTGRSRFGLIPATSCLIETFVNPDYAERSLSVKIVLTVEQNYIEMLEDAMKQTGKLTPGNRVLTPKDAALIASEPGLKRLLTAESSSGTTTILESVPEGAHGPDMLDHVKSLFREELSERSRNAPR